jgi:hypothetical protein
LRVAGFRRGDGGASLVDGKGQCLDPRKVTGLAAGRYQLRYQQIVAPRGSRKPAMVKLLWDFR